VTLYWHARISDYLWLPGTSVAASPRVYDTRCCEPVVIALVLAITCASAEARAEDDAVQESKTEFTPAPILGGSSDLGFGGGLLASLSYRQPGVEPYTWRLELASLTLFKVPDGTVQVPYMDNYLDLALPHLIGNRFKFQTRLAYTREAAVKYYGIGNASTVPTDRSLEDPYYAYGWEHPGITAKLSEHVAGPFWLVFSLGYSFNAFRRGLDTKLEQDRRSSNTFVAERVDTVATHSDLALGYAVEIDTRDTEVSPSKGQYHTLRVALSPGGAPAVSGPWGRVNATARAYIPFDHEGTLLSFRMVSDFLFGQAPIYELARYDDIGMLGTGAFGGPNGVRGIPAQRYHGMIKVFGSIEFRTYVVDFDLLDKTNRLGFVVFVDAGRLWADYRPQPELDGSGLGLKYGMGAGLRLLGGSSFVLRADIAWSPDARPIGAYLAAGQAF
jgi:outer membrane protein assembly factor BamA